MKKIAPSILNADLSNLSQQIRYVEIGGADWIHCDIMDGHFVPNITFGPPVVKAVKNSTRLPVDVHLMIDNAEKYLESFVENGADILTVHQEAQVHLNRTLTRIKELGIKAGVSVNPSTPVYSLHEVLELVDLILIMTVNPGFGGQSFIESTLRKVEQLSALRERNGYKFLIETDGGISKENILSVSNAGCDVFVVGSAIFKSDNISATTTELRNIVNTIIV